MDVVCQIRNKRQLERDLQELKKAPEKAMKAMNRDAKKRVKGWVQDEIVRAYGVTPAQIKSKEIGTIRIKGKILDSLQFQYRGRPLTPTHFNMTPTTPPGRAYTLRAMVTREGGPKTLGNVKELTPKQRARLARNFKRTNLRRSRRSPVMLMPAGKGNSKYIPFQRVSDNRKDIKAVKTLSFAQMVSSRRTNKQIQDAITNGMLERVDFYMKKYMPGD